MIEAPIFSLDKKNYIAIAPVRDGPAGNFKQAVHVNIAKNRMSPLTHGKYEVSKILTWDHSNDVM